MTAQSLSSKGWRSLKVPAEGGALSDLAHGPDYRIDPATGCWEWQKFKLRGYGKVRMAGYNGHAHKLYWMLATGRDVPAGFDVHHTCENPGCVNPDHMELLWKPHHVREHKRATVALSDEQRAEIRQLGADPDLTQQDIADRFGIPRPTVNKILNGYSWFDGERVIPERDCRGCGEKFTGTNRKQRYCATCRPRRAAA